MRVRGPDNRCTTLGARRSGRLRISVHLHRIAFPSRHPNRSAATLHSGRSMNSHVDRSAAARKSHVWRFARLLRRRILLDRMAVPPGRTFLVLRNPPISPDSSQHHRRPRGLEEGSFLDTSWAPSGNYDHTAGFRRAYFYATSAESAGDLRAHLSACAAALPRGVAVRYYY